MKDFNYWDKLFKDERLEELSKDNSGLLWLKLKSIIRTEIVKNFLRESELQVTETSQAGIFKELFEKLSSDLEHSNVLLNNFIRNESQRQMNAINIKQLVSELYKLKIFEWGGDYQNSLDRYLVSKYVKIHNPSFDDLMSKFETEINHAVQGYVLNSWYNYWSSVLIENIFKCHNAVLSAVGQIKSVDFFVHDIPFDLKVTYLPAEYIKQQRKEMGLSTELNYLKQQAKKANIGFDSKANTNSIFYEITEKMRDRNDDLCRKSLQKLQNEKIAILKDAQAHPLKLAKWLYENQGKMRFGSENRLFLVLVDIDDFNNSWKLKRNIDLLKPVINSYLDNFKNKKLNDLRVDFRYEGKPHDFTVLADV